MKALTLFLSLFFVIPTFAQNLTSVQTEYAHTRSDPARPESAKSYETKIGKDLVCHPGALNPTPVQPPLKLGDRPVDHSVVPKIDSPPPLPVKTAFINPGG